MDHNRWRKQIRDDCRCKWVNVSSDTGLPGCAGQNPESRKMVVCVCVCVWCVKNTRIVTTWR